MKFSVPPQDNVSKDDLKYVPSYVLSMTYLAKNRNEKADK